MKVWELIAKLGKMPANAEVHFSYDADPGNINADCVPVEVAEFDENFGESEPFVTSIMRRTKST